MNSDQGVDAITTLLGKPLNYWIEVKQRIDLLDIDHLLDALTEANAKVRYYEQQLDRIEQFRARFRK